MHSMPMRTFWRAGPKKRDIWPSVPSPQSSNILVLWGEDEGLRSTQMPDTFRYFEGMAAPVPVNTIFMSTSSSSWSCIEESFSVIEEEDEHEEEEEEEHESCEWSFFSREG